MHDERSLIEARLRRTVRDRIRPAVYGERLPLEVAAWEAPGEPVPVDVARANAFSPFPVGGRWGKPWGTTWFRMEGRIPDRWAGETVEARVDFFSGVGPGFQSEGMVYPIDAGGPIRGINPDHTAIPVSLVTGADDTVAFLVEAAANPNVATSYQPTPLGDPATAGETPIYRLNTAELAVRHDDVWHLDLDLGVIIGLTRQLPADDGYRLELLELLDRAVDLLDPQDVVGTAAAMREAIAPALERSGRPDRHHISAAGHAHIDSAWLWPLRETRRKCARTFSSAVTFMDAYPEYRFVCSQAAQYEWVEQDHPELFDRIREKVAAGQFIPVGSMWVEADTNLPSGESLARQLVWGKRYFADRFGVDTTEVWLPDVFGYCGNLPQIMAQAGVESFLTQKLSWNQTNRFPHHTFWWEGIDGTRTFSHFPPADTYVGDMKAEQLVGAARNFRENGRARHSMYLFGHGDGGGGPTREMIERARRVRDVEGYPLVEVEAPDAFFRAARAEYPDAPVWRGELYFEMHRGTYTSQAKTKAGNRRVELALREAELWTATAADAPLADLERWWKTALVHQFHDIIPGSSIAWVHQDTEADHAELLSEIDATIDSSLQAMADATCSGTPAGAQAVAANGGPFPVRGVVDTDAGLTWVDAPALGVGPVVDERPGDVVPAHVRSVNPNPAVERGADDGPPYVLDNGLVAVVIGSDGTILSFRDQRVDRECLAAPGNVLQLFPDYPNTYDAWDIDAHTLALEPELLTDVDSMEIAVLGDGLAASVRVIRTFGPSTVTQAYRLSAGSARLDIVSDVDWHHDERLLKAAFPLDLRADDARYDIQYGHVRRPTHRNTTWDAARFEVCGHFWADVSEPGFGVAVLNDSKYGYDCAVQAGDADGGPATVLRLSLLRAPSYPDPRADRGRHHFTYSLLPHLDSLPDVIAEAWALNLPPRIIAGRPAAPVVVIESATAERGPGVAGDPCVVVTAVKAADDGSGDLIVRYHEAAGGRARFNLAFGLEYTSATTCDLLEVGQDTCTVERRSDGERNQINRELRPFQIETIRLSSR